MNFRNIILLITLFAISLPLVSCAGRNPPENTTDPAGAPSAGAGPASDTETAAYHKITAQEAKKRMDENPDAIVVDVRTESEYEQERIEGALLIPNESIGAEKPKELPDLGSEILIYCRSGNRSRQAAEKLTAMGYTKVYDFGGIIDWPYDTVSGQE